jgi:ribonuclease P protein component
MLKKISRLTKDKEFEKVFKHGKSAYNNLFSAKSLPNDLAQNRYGIIVSKKVHKNAVERNKIKRRTREALKSFNELIKTKHDIVIVCRPNMVNVSGKEIKNIVYLIFKKLKLVNDNKKL